MKKIIINGTHPVFLKNSDEEINMLFHGSSEEIFYYICCRGIKSLSAQKMLLECDAKWVELQKNVHPEMWHPKVRTEMEKRGFLPEDTTSDDEQKENFKRWLHHNLMVSPLSYVSEKEYGIASQLLLAAGANLSKPLSEEEEITLLRTKAWDRVREYGRRLNAKAEILFFETAPVELVFAYIRLFRPQSDEAECAILLRNDSYLSWELISLYSLSKEAKNLVKNSGNKHAWKSVVMRSYGFDSKLEQKFGTIRNLQTKLEQSFDKKYFA